MKTFETVVPFPSLPFAMSHFQLELDAEALERMDELTLKARKEQDQTTREKEHLEVCFRFARLLSCHAKPALTNELCMIHSKRNEHRCFVCVCVCSKPVASPVCICRNTCLVAHLGAPHSAVADTRPLPHTLSSPVTPTLP